MAIFRILNLLTDLFVNNVSKPAAARAEQGYHAWVGQTIARLHEQGGAVRFERGQREWAYRAVNEGHLMLTGDDQVALPPAARPPPSSPLNDLYNKK
ncbi:MAG TPA: hypothetical protein VFF06_00440 [Polyangia bacterium]|nr:hypothetical protein [Polyangia bacterium]